MKTSDNKRETNKHSTEPFVTRKIPFPKGKIDSLSRTPGGKSQVARRLPQKKRQDGSRGGTWSIKCDSVIANIKGKIVVADARRGAGLSPRVRNKEKRRKRRKKKERHVAGHNTETFGCPRPSPTIDDASRTLSCSTRGQVSSTLRRERG